MKKYAAKCYQKDYPRPQFVRSGWQNLNGKWDFAFDRTDEGLQKGYFNGFEKQTDILVPFPYQTKESGVFCEESVPGVWYRKKVQLKFEKDEQIILHLEGSDYYTEVYLNGVLVGKGEGAYHRQSYDVTAAAKCGENDLIIRVTDDYSPQKPRGKQRSKSEDYGCWYIDMTGLYKTVWVETVNAAHIKRVKTTPSYSKKSLKAEYFFSDKALGAKAQTIVSYQGAVVAKDEFIVTSCDMERELSLGETVYPWEAGDGKIYDVEYILTCGEKVVDKVGGYFGLRDISWDSGSVRINGKPVYHKFALDQGYFYGSDLTPKSEEELEFDLTTLLKMGFNGVRKHEKFEDERFFYLADVYGYLVWNEMPSFYEFTEVSKKAFDNDWYENVEQIYNHPSVLALVLFNESWGIPEIKTDKEQQKFVDEAYFKTKKIDSTRPVITNDGWRHTISDILTIHHYTQSGENLYSYFDTLEKCTAEFFADHQEGAFADGYSYKGQPIMISEFGGTSFVKDTVGGAWGYGNAVKDDEEFLQRFSSLINAIYKMPCVCGFCYTQVTDVYREVNGLMDFARNLKFPAETIAKILETKK